MADTYAHLKSLDQRTEFWSALIPFTPPPTPFGIPQKPENNPGGKREAKAEETTAKKEGEERKLDRSLRLQFASPNRLRLEMEEPNPGGLQPTRYQWVSDGKVFWTTIPEKNWYTREKAPKQIADFAKLARLNSGSLEMLMLMGINPFAGIKEQVDSMTWDGAATVHEVLTDVVTLRAESRFSETEAKLYIGHDDLLLRRLVVETTPIVGPIAPGKIGDALDDLADDDTGAVPMPSEEGGDSEPPLLSAPASPPNATPKRTRVVLDNILATNLLDMDTFRFLIPEGASRYGNDETQTKKRKNQPLFKRKKLRRLKF